MLRPARKARVSVRLSASFLKIIPSPTLEASGTQHPHIRTTITGAIRQRSPSRFDFHSTLCNFLEARGIIFGPKIPEVEGYEFAHR
jgi:hypothetical protein